MAVHPDLMVHVYYCHKATAQEQSRAGFGVAFDWDVPLLEGYSHSFLQNIANPAAHGRFAGFDTPEIAKIIRERRYDAVLINGWNYKSAWQAIWAAWRSGVKVLVRGDSHLHVQKNLPTRLIKLLVYRRFVPRLDACLAAGEWSREYFAHYGAPSDRIFFVPHAIDSAYMDSESRRLQPVRTELRRRWGLSADGIVFLFVGKFTATKRPLDFARSILVASRKDQSVKGLMVGDGPLRGSCEEFVRSHCAPVAFTGFLNQSQIVQAYAAGDVLVLPSIGETWGMVVNEAMACGRTCVVSDRVGCGPDLIIPGKTGAIFPHSNVPALSDCILNLARNRSAVGVMGESARDRLNKYSIDAAVGGVLESLAATVRAPEFAWSR